MKGHARSLLLSAIGILSFAASGTSALADIVNIDKFSISKNGGSYFADTFSDGLPPPIGEPQGTRFCANSPPDCYGVAGTFTESGGRAIMNSSMGAVLPSLVTTGPQTYFVHNATALTDTQDVSISSFGLKTNSTFQVSGLFDLSVPSVPAARYGVLLTDNGPTGAGMLIMSVERNLLAGAPLARLAYVDASTGIFTRLAWAPLEQSHDQILLTLSRNSTENSLITGSFAYYDKGIAGDTITFATTGQIFTHGETWTQAGFQSLVPVPEPETYATLLSGLTVLAFIGRRRKLIVRPI